MKYNSIKVFQLLIIKILSLIFSLGECMNLEKIRKLKNFSQQEVANVLKISQGSYCNYEKGKRQPDINTLIKLSDLFNVSLDALVRDKSYRYSENQQQLIMLIENLNETECAKVAGFIEGMKR